MKRPLWFVMAMLFVIPSTAHALIPSRSFEIELSISDQKLFALAVQHNIVRWNTRDEFNRRGFIPTNDLKNWFIFTPAEKVAVIRLYRKWLFKQTGTLIRKPAEYYVQLFNLQLYSVVSSGKWNEMKNYNIVGFLQTLAILEGDAQDASSVAASSTQSPLLIR